jgi:N-acetylglucosaminyl-diphospho-decaprenol L-rhamnosyltransferase
MTDPRLSVIIVAHNSLTDLRRTLPMLCAELGSADEVIVVDSGSEDALRAQLPELAPAARLIVAGGNVGFAAGANLGAAAARGELLVLLNPDAAVQPGWGTAIREPWAGPWAAWMALVTLDSGRAINTAGGVLHFTGLGWAGQIGELIDTAPQVPTEVGFLSGACLAIPVATWRETGGFPADFFMYCEDVDLSLRLRLRGGRIAVVPDARVLHDYEFAKGAQKWRLLERNRWATVLRTFPGPLLVLLAPGLLITELAIWAAAISGGWGGMKARATLDLIRLLPQLRHERRGIQAARRISSAQFAAGLTAELSSPYLGAAARSGVIAMLMGRYWAAVRSLLSLSSRAA